MGFTDPRREKLREDFLRARLLDRVQAEKENDKRREQLFIEAQLKEAKLEQEKQDRIIRRKQMEQNPGDMKAITSDILKKRIEARLK